MDLFVQAKSREEELLISALCKRTECDVAHCRRCLEPHAHEKTNRKVDAMVSEMRFRARYLAGIL